MSHLGLSQSLPPCLKLKVKSLPQRGPSRSLYDFQLVNFYTPSANVN